MKGHSSNIDGDTVREATVFGDPRAICANTDPEVWFPDAEAEEVQAVRLCRDCPLLNACREYALNAGEIHGVWGGLTPADRRRIHRSGQRARYAANARERRELDDDALDAAILAERAALEAERLAGEA